LKGVVRVEVVKDPVEYIPAVIERVSKAEVLDKAYKIEGGWNDHIEFLERLAKRFGKLLKGGEPDLDTVSKMVLNDFIRGKIPYFIPPPDSQDKKDKKQAAVSEDEKNNIQAEEQNFDEMLPRENDETDDEKNESQNVGSIEANDNAAKMESLPEFNEEKTKKRRKHKMLQKIQSSQSNFQDIDNNRARSTKTVLDMSSKFKKLKK
jgi:nuclear GTP-binding protein